MQAQFEANVGRLETNLGRCVTNIDKLRVSVVDLAEVLRESVRISDDRFTRFDERLTKLADAQASTDEWLKELADAQKASDERLNALINVVEGHNAGPDHEARP